MTTFADVLAGRLRREPGQPLVTFYDHATGERTELSVTTYANWVAKVGSYLVEECGLERGDALVIDLPAHWLGTVVLGAAWTVGLVVVDGGAADAVVCGPDSVAARAGTADVVVATALHPLARPFDTALPAGVRDLGVEVWAQPDAFTPWDPPTGADEAAPGLRHDALWEAATRSSLLEPGGRLLSEVNPASPSGFSSFTEPLVLSGSLVLVAHGDPARLDATYAAEHATARLSVPS